MIVLELNPTTMAGTGAETETTPEKEMTGIGLEMDILEMVEMEKMIEIDLVEPEITPEKEKMKEIIRIEDTPEKVKMTGIGKVKTQIGTPEPETTPEKEKMTEIGIDNILGKEKDTQKETIGGTAMTETEDTLEKDKDMGTIAEIKTIIMIMELTPMSALTVMASTAELAEPQFLPSTDPSGMRTRALR